MPATNSIAVENCDVSDSILLNIIRMLDNQLDYTASTRNRLESINTDLFGSEGEKPPAQPDPVPSPDSRMAAIELLINLINQNLDDIARAVTKLERL